jgi:Dyp-type peroxidase family
MAGIDGAEVTLRSNNYVQGNILAGFNKAHQVFLFLSFGRPWRDQAQANARRWLAELSHPAGDHIATTRQVADFKDDLRNERRRLNGRHPPHLRSVWANVSLTYSGLLTLHPELQPDLDRYPAFRSGPAGPRKDENGATTTTAALLGDIGHSHPDHWVIGRSGRKPHALLTIAADREDELLARLEEERARARRSGLRVLREEMGQALTGRRHGTEHFGFKDGISQPGIRGFTRSVVRRRRMEDADHPGSPIIASGEFLLGRVRERRADGSAHPPAPWWMWDGSFQVFRRLTQDVPGWHAEMKRLRPPSLTAKELAAKVVGRRLDGRPLEPGRRLGDNDFDYDSDPAGYGTPRFAHVRKMNPRSDRVFGDRTHRILRRGITFGPPYDPARSPTGGAPVERGLLFNAFMACIEEQFEFLQRSWANDPRFPSVPLDTNAPEEATVDGADPVVGAGTDPCVLHLDGRPDQRLDFGRFVHTTGAVYAFAPSILTLRRLARGELLRQAERPLPGAQLAGGLVDLPEQPGEVDDLGLHLFG